MKNIIDKDIPVFVQTHQVKNSEDRSQRKKE
jgi:hypothetical protein